MVSTVDSLTGRGEHGGHAGARRCATVAYGCGGERHREDEREKGRLLPGGNGWGAAGKLQARLEGLQASTSSRRWQSGVGGWCMHSTEQLRGEGWKKTGKPLGWATSASWAG